MPGKEIHMNKLTLPIAAAALAAAALGAHAAVPASLLGDIAATEQAAREIVITPTTKWVNVTQGETVNFTENGQTFAIRFDGVESSFDLNRLAPAGALDHKVVAYVAPNSEDSR